MSRFAISPRRFFSTSFLFSLVFAVSAFMVCFSGPANGQKGGDALWPEADSDSIARRQNESSQRTNDAIRELKDRGQYDSLMDAVKAARQANGQTGDLLVPAAIGESAKLTASDGAAYNSFGFTVAVSGDTAVVGAYKHTVGANVWQGSAYVFVKSGNIWSQQQQLTASDGAAGDRFGESVAISGDTAIVGAQFDVVGPNTWQGSAYVFVRSGTVWSQQAKLTASDGAVGDEFGWSVAISGDTAVVGTPIDTVGAHASQGSAYVFTRSGTVWSQQQKLTASDGAAGDNFGASVAISGDTAVVGAYQDTVGANAGQGSAYVFTRSGTVWSQQQQLIASDGAASNYFGGSVAISGDTAVVGADQNTVGANALQGTAYVFTRSGTLWSQQQQLTASDGVTYDEFGVSVAIDGDTAVVGAHGANTQRGTAYVFTRSGTLWSQQQQLTASDGAASDKFGKSVAISGGTAVVGAFGANIDQGSAYVYELGATPSPTLTVSVTGTGSVTSSPAGIDCGATCSALFPVSSVVSFITIASSGSVFSGWSGDASCGNTIIMDTNMNCTATFVQCPNLPVSIMAGPWSSINAAYTNAASTDIIKAIGSTFAETLDFSSPKNITLSGGYDCDLNLQTGLTYVTGGALIIGDGTVIVDRIAIY